MITVYIASGIIAIGATLYIVFVRKSKEFLKFLTGSFFMSAGIQFYLYFAGVSLPLLGTSFIQTPEISLARAIPHTIFFLLCLYFGFIRKTKDSKGSSPAVL